MFRSNWILPYKKEITPNFSVTVRNEQLVLDWYSTLKISLPVLKL